MLLDDFAPEDRSGQFAPGLFGTGDLDGDGRLDIVVAGDPRVFVLLQTSPGDFAVEVLEPQLGQAGGMLIANLDDDEAQELVLTSYADHVVVLYDRAL